MGLYDNIGTAQVSGSGQYFKPGQYRVQVQEVKEITSRKGVNFFIVEVTVLRTTNPDYQAGATIGWPVNMSQDYALGNIKEFAQALASDMQAKVTGKDIEAMLGEDQPAAGMELDVDAIERISRQGNTWTQARWRPRGTLTMVRDGSDN